MVNPRIIRLPRRLKTNLHMATPAEDLPPEILQRHPLLNTYSSIFQDNNNL